MKCNAREFHTNNIFLSCKPTSLPASLLPFTPSLSLSTLAPADILHLAPQLRQIFTTQTTPVSTHMHHRHIFTSLLDHHLPPPLPTQLFTPSSSTATSPPPAAPPSPVPPRPTLAQGVRRQFTFLRVNNSYLEGQLSLVIAVIIGWCPEAAERPD